MDPQSQQWWSEVFEQLHAASGPDELFKRVTSVSSGLGFRYCCYGIRHFTQDGTAQTEVYDSYPPQWMDHYEKSGYLEIDSSVRIGAQSSGLLLWSDELFKSAPQLWQDAQDWGMPVGLAQSSWGANGAYGLLSLARGNDPLSESELKYLRPRVSWLSENAHRRMQALLADCPTCSTAVTLSSREHEVICWTAEGKTSWEIGQILNISESTVNFHVRNLLLKLNARNKIQASVNAALLGLLAWRELSTELCRKAKKCHDATGSGRQYAGSTA